MMRNTIRPALVLFLAVGIGISVGAPVQGKSAAKAKTPVTASKDSEVLAWIGGKPITKKDVEARVEELQPQFRQQFSTPEGRKQLLDRMIEEQVWMMAAEKAKVPERPELIRQIEQTKKNMILRAYVGEIMQGVPAPNDSSVAAYYEAHKSEPQYQQPEAVKVRHIQVATEAEAKNVLLKLKKGADFATLAKQVSTDPGSKNDGGLVERLERSGAFGTLGRQVVLTDTSFSAPLHTPIGPLHSSVGWHVLEVEEKMPASAFPLDAMRPRIMQSIARQSQEDYYKVQLEKAKADAGLKMNQAAVDSFVVGQRNAGDLFREAQDAANADERIAGYQKVLDEFPKSDQAPQAAFMIGFVYSEEKKDYDKAEAAFKKLLTDYPKSELRHSAEWMLANMRSDAVPNFELPGGVKRTAPDSTAKQEGLRLEPVTKGATTNGTKK